MASGTAQSNLFGSQGKALVQAHEQHKTVAPPADNQLPGGVEGIAQVRMCKFGIYEEGKNKGKPFFLAQAKVVAPVEVEVDIVEGVVKKGGQKTKIRGATTGVGPEKMFDTPDATGGDDPRKMFAQHWQWYQDIMKILVGQSAVAAVSGTPQQIEQGMRNLMAAVEQRKPFIKFRTFKIGERVFNKWIQVVDWKETPSATAATKDSSTSAPSPAQAAAEEPSDNGSPTETPSTGEFIGDLSLPDEADKLAAIADGVPDYTEDEQASAAVLRIQHIAEQEGVSEEAMAETSNWSEAAALIREAVEAKNGTGQDDPAEDQEEPAAEQDEPPAEPKKGDMCLYQLLDSKGNPILNKNTKKPLKPIQCQIKIVDKKSKTCTLLNAADQKTEYKKVPWSQCLSQ